MESSCPCGSENSYQNCCGVFHSGIMKAPTAEKLMRSRYSAFVLNKEDYLLNTWQVLLRPKQLNLSEQNLTWKKLQIIRTENGDLNDDAGIVEFIAEYNTPKGPGKLHEISNFVKENETWFYVDGKVIN